MPGPATPLPLLVSAGAEAAQPPEALVPLKAGLRGWTPPTRAAPEDGGPCSGGLKGRAVLVPPRGSGWDAIGRVHGRIGVITGIASSPRPRPKGGMADCGGGTMPVEIATPSSVVRQKPDLAARPRLPGVPMPVLLVGPSARPYGVLARAGAERPLGQPDPREVGSAPQPFS